MKEVTPLKNDNSTSAPKKFWTLFSSTFLLSAFTFGGGFVIVPLMRKKFVENLGWIDEQEMLDITAISQSSPGPIAVNASILVGYRVAGIPGALVTVAGTVLPPLIVISIISMFYAAFRDNVIVNRVMDGMLAGVAAVICDVVLTMGWDIIRQKKWLPVLILAGAFIAVRILGVNIMYIILACALIGAASTLINERRRGGGRHDIS